VLTAAARTLVEALEERRLFNVSVGVTVSPTDIVMGSSVNLYVSATADGTLRDAYNVNWGDGGQAQTYNFSDSCTPTHTYPTAGNYSIEADATDDEPGCVVCTGCGFASLEVDPPPAPVITHSISGASTGTEDSTYTLNMSWSDSDGAAVDWFLNWGDGNATDAGAATSATHTYTDSGSYDISATAQSADGNFTDSKTVSVSPAVQDLSATASSVSQIALAWTNNAGGAATGIEVGRSTDAATWSTLATLGGSATTYTNTGLSEDQHYYYQVRALFGGGVNSSYSNVADAFTPLQAPTSLGATAVNSGAISLQWTNHSTIASGVRIDRSSDGGNSFSTVATVAANATTFSDIRVNNETSYTYEVLATAADGDVSAPSNTTSATTPLAPPIGLTASVSSGTLILNWPAVPNAVTYKVYRSATATGTWTLLTSSPTTLTTFTDSSPPTGVISYYQVYAQDSNNVASSPASAQTPDRIGIYISSTGAWYLDMNGNQQWEPSGGDTTYSSFSPPAGSQPVSGAWNSSLNGKQIGLFDPTTGTFYLDTNGNGQWNSGTDATYAFGQSGDQPVIGNWNGGATSQVGVFRPSNNTFYLDLNGNGHFDSGTDLTVAVTPPSGGSYIAISGRWNGPGASEIGLYDTNSGTFYLYDLTGNLIGSYQLVYYAGALPVIGDWNGSGGGQLGLYVPSTNTFYLDSNGDFTWASGDSQFTFTTATGGKPISF